METSPPPVSPPPSYAPPAPPPKKGLGTGAKIGIGCGGLVLLVIIALIVVAAISAPKLKKFAEDAQKNPPKATAELMVTASGGKLEIVARDDAAKRYTLKDTKSGDLTTIYWDEKTQSPKTITGDFSAIPADAPPAGDVLPDAH